MNEQEKNEKKILLQKEKSKWKWQKTRDEIEKNSYVFRTIKLQNPGTVYRNFVFFCQQLKRSTRTT